MSSCQVKQDIVSSSHVSWSDAGRDLKEKETARKPRELNLLWAEGGRAALQSHWFSPSLCIRRRVGQYLQRVCSCNPQELCRKEGTYEQVLFCRRQVVTSSRKTLSRSWCYTRLTPALRLWGNMVLWCSRRHHFGQVQGVSSGFSMKPDSRASGSIAYQSRTARPQQLPVHPRCTLQISVRAQLIQRALAQCLSHVSPSSTGELRVSTHSSLSTDY